MTAIVALFDRCRTFLAADRMALIPDGPTSFIVCRDTDKVVTIGDWTVAASGTAGVLEVLRNDAALAASGTAHIFFDRVKAVFGEIGLRAHRSDDDDREGGLVGYPCEFILCRAGECWFTGPGLLPLRAQVGRPIAIGSGCITAAAAAWAVLKFGADPARAVAGGIAAASEYLTGIGSEATVCVVGSAP